MVRRKANRNTGQGSDGEPPQEPERTRNRGTFRAENGQADSKNGGRTRKQPSAHTAGKAANGGSGRGRKPTSEISKKGLKAPNPEASAVLSDICQDQAPLVVAHQQSLSKVDETSALADRLNEPQHYTA